jgi:transcriptional regulator with XRE-family HTH domain
MRTLAVSSDALKRLRAARGWSAEDLAGKCDITAKTIGSIENAEGGEKGCYAATVRVIAKALGAEVSDLLACVPVPTPPTPAPPVQERKFRVTIEMTGYGADFDHTSDLPRIMKALAMLLKVGDIEPEAARSGSVMIDLLLTEGELHKLVNAFMHTRGLDPDSAPTYEDIMRDIDRDPDIKHGMRAPREFLAITSIQVEDSDSLPDSVRGKTFG